MSSTNQTNIADATAAATVKSDGKRDTGRTRRNNANDTPDVKLSKELAYILRHGAEKKGLKLRDDGSISLDDLRRYQKLKSVTFDEIKHAVDTNNKKRFTLYQEKDTWYIRAVQGHSLAIKEPPLVKLTAKTVPPVIVH
ncbi:tRNA 2'-phosphotransferase, partial [Coemansia sp. 'formosensis']